MTFPCVSYFYRPPTKLRGGTFSVVYVCHSVRMEVIVQDPVVQGITLVLLPLQGTNLGLLCTGPSPSLYSPPAKYVPICSTWTSIYRDTTPDTSWFCAECKLTTERAYQSPHTTRRLKFGLLFTDWGGVRFIAHTQCYFKASVCVCVCVSACVSAIDLQDPVSLNTLPLLASRQILTSDRFPLKWESFFDVDMWFLKM